MKYYILFFFALVWLPGRVFADIHITEIAWMGTATSQYSEWFELYNDGSGSVNLAGWKLAQADGATIFTLTKSIDAGSYLLVERTTASAPDAVPGINDEAGPFSASGFANTGEDLMLTDASGVLVESLSFASGWPAGDATTKQTMQWNGDEWITAAATPKAGTSGTASSPGDESEIVDEEKDPDPIPAVSPNKPHIEFVVPSIIYTGVPYTYQAHPVFEYGYVIDSGDFYWNMGDGTMLRQQIFEPLSHTYQYSGTYTISFRYTDPTNHNAALSGTKKVTVTTPTCTLSIIDGKAVQLKNVSSTSIDLSGWNFVADRAVIPVPDLTIIAEKATITIPFTILSISHATRIELRDPSGTTVASTDPVAAAATTTVAYDDAPYEAPDLTSSSLIAHAAGNDTTNPPIRNRTKSIIFGAVALFVIVLSILLERFKAQQEYSSQYKEE